MALDPGEVYFDGMCGHATRIPEARFWRNHVPADKPRHETVESNLVSGAPAASVASTDAGSSPVDTHHSSFAEAMHHLHHLRR